MENLKGYILYDYTTRYLTQKTHRKTSFKNNYSNHSRMSVIFKEILYKVN